MEDSKTKKAVTRFGISFEAKEEPKPKGWILDDLISSGIGEGFDEMPEELLKRKNKTDKKKKVRFDATVIYSSS